jgi:predicted Rossmann fold nucleotide-binding protein DprA/Smf involved in DNA uptake
VTQLVPKQPASYAALGNGNLLHTRKLGLFCSVRCPGKVILQTYELARFLRYARVTVVGGFHSPMERECLRLLLGGTAPLIVCPARSIDGMRVPPDWRASLEQGRLLVLSPFRGEQRRVTARLAAERNAFVASVADALFVTYAEPGGKTERFCRDALAAGKPVYTFDACENRNLLAFGGQPVREGLDLTGWAF